MMISPATGEFCELGTQVVILGYHRSGTSAIGQNLEAAGLFLGEDLLGAKPSNPFGHYEDREFFEINEAIFKLNYTQWNTTADVVPIISQQLVEVASDLVAKRDSCHELWGFKDPRSCVLLDFWHSVLPNPIYVVCLRHYSACIDSVMRRQVRDFYSERNPGVAGNITNNFQSTDAICANWCIYMTSVLKFLTQRAPKSVVFRVDRLSGAASVANMLREGFDMDLEPIPLGETFAPELFQGDEVPALPISSDMRQVAEEVWQQLCALEDEAVSARV